MIYSVNNSASNYLNVIATALGVNLQGPNPDLSVFTLFLTFDQARQLVQAVALELVTSGIGTTGGVTLNGMSVVPNPALNQPILGFVYTIAPTAVSLVIPLSGGYIGTNYTQALTTDQVASLTKALSHYLVTNQ